MQRFATALLLAGALLTTWSAAAGDGDAPAGPKKDRYRVHVLTMGQGDELFARFGHIGLMVDDAVHRTRKVYNFGTFDFEDPALRLKYARGFLNYWLSIQDWRSTVMQYQYFDRDLTMRTLSLDQAQAAQIVRRLEVNALPENRGYAYRHYMDNCCTRIRDLLDDVVDGAISRGRRDGFTGRTFRDWTRDALRGLPVMSAMILYSLGPAVDRPITRWEEEFLPAVLAEDLDATRIGPDKRPLVASKRRVVKRVGATVGVVAPTWERTVEIAFLAMLAIGLLAPLALGRRRAAARLAGLGLLIWGLTAGLGGLMLVLYWAATTHYDTHYNENLLVNPVLHLWLVGPALVLIFKARLGARTARIVGWYLAAAMALILFDALMKLGPFVQNNWGVIALASTCNLLAVAALWRTGSLSRPPA